MTCETCGAPDPRGLCGLGWARPGEDPPGMVRAMPYVPIQARVGYSEVAMHMRVAGRVMWMVWVAERDPFTVTLEQRRFGGMVQLLTDDWEPFSFPILPGEAGLYEDAQGLYGYER